MSVLILFLMIDYCELNNTFLTGFFMLEIVLFSLDWSVSHGYIQTIIAKRTLKSKLFS